MNPRVKKIGSVLLLAGGLSLGTSCTLFKKPDDSGEGVKPVARVYDRYLYEEDVKAMVPEELSGGDSLAFIQNYINVWAKDQLMIYKAEYNLTDNKKNFEEQIQEYRNDLLKFAYRQEYVRQNLDTNVTEDQLRAYYGEGENNFVLQHNILKARYVVVDSEAPEVSKAKRWFRSSNPDNQEKLNEFALKYAYRFSLEDSAWVNLDQVKELLHLSIDDPQRFLSETEFYEYEDSTNVYLLEIVSYKLKGQRAPLEYSREIIRNILLNKRKLELIDKLEQNLLSDAMDKKEFEVYDR